MAAEPITLRADVPAGHPGFTEATILPWRGMMLLHARLRLPSGTVVDAIHAPPDALAQLDGGPEDFAGNKAFSFGGAILAPYANRIRGAALAGSREIETQVGDRVVRLPRNWGGKAQGAEQYAMHGLILDVDVPWRQPAADCVTGVLAAGDFGGRWPSRTELSFAWRLEDGALVLTVDAANVGAEDLPLGLGWHPYFALPSQDRSQARLRVPATHRVEVNDYDEVLPTGQLLATAGTAYDFRAPEGAPLGGLYLDDCFTGLLRDGGEALVEIRDRAAGVGLRIASPTPEVKAVQVYAPPDQSFVVVEPQFNLADPFGSEWNAQVDTGMAKLRPGEKLTYEVRVSAFAVGTS